MRSIDETFETFGNRVLWLGYAGEEDRSTLIVDLHDILLEFPGATAVLKVRPPDEKAAYPAITETIDDKLHWSIGDSDTAKEGRGELQLSLISPTGSKIKTAVAAMEISRSLPDGGQKPDRIDDWMEKAEVARKKAEEAATKAGTATTKANEATSKANTAASNADTKAKLANDAATKATDAAKRAEDAAEKADKARQNILIGSETGNPVSVSDAFSAPLCGLTVYGKSTQDGTPTPDAPVPIVSAGDGGSVVVKVTGRNLVYTHEYQSFFINTSGSLAGLADGNTSIVLQVPTGAEYYVTRKAVGTKFRVAVVDKLPSKSSPVAPSNSVRRDSERQIKISATSKYMIIQCEDESAFDELMVSLDSSATYSPYREQLLTLPTPNGLPGIPVTSGGNYTDPSGQQWVCDEVDLERGVKVQRVYKVDVDGENVKFVQVGSYANLTSRELPFALISSGQKTYAVSTFTNLGWNYNLGSRFLYLVKDNISDKFNESCKKQLGKVYYALANPIETPLTPAEIAAYKALTTYAPDTVVQAADGAGLKLDYQRDVNIVIKNLEDAIASMTAT